MAQPITFISHFTIKPGKLNDVKSLAHEVASGLDAKKPRTLIFLIYLDDKGAAATFVHLFADPDAMDLHFAGAHERSRAAFEFMDPDGWEIYGQPSERALAGLREAATSAGVALTVHPEYLTGFIRFGGKA